MENQANCSLVTPYPFLGKIAARIYLIQCGMRLKFDLQFGKIVQ